MNPTTFATYNTLDLFKHDDADERVRHGRVIQVIRDLNVDVLAVQEIAAPDADLAARRLQELAEAVGMRCRHAPGQVAVGVGSRGLHVGLLWRDGLDVVAGSFRTYPGGRFWHNLATITVDVDGRQLRHASYHAPPFGRTVRTDETEWVAATMTRPAGRPPGLIAADWNSLGDDRRADGTYYDPDPYPGRPWQPDFIHQTRWLSDARGQPCDWIADREPGRVLSAAHLCDAAAVLDVAWHATSGHWPACSYGPRRIDGIRVTAEIVPALLDVTVVDTALTRWASDHLPVVVTYDRRRIAWPPATAP